MFMVEQDQLRIVLRELFVEYLSDSCKFSLHWKATSLYLLSSKKNFQQVEAGRIRVAVDVRLAGVINRVMTLVMVILMMVMVMVMMSRISAIEHHRQPWSVGKVDQGLICQNSDRVVSSLYSLQLQQYCTALY